MSHALTLRAGPDALRLVRERGLRAQDIDILPGASGGAKWLALAGLDRYLFGTLLAEPRTRPLHLIGSSIGSWRMACLAQRDPVAALARGHHAYIYEQRYSPKPSTAEVTRVLNRALDLILGPTGVDEILTHPWARVHIITAEGRGLAASERRLLLTAGIALAAAGNLVSRKSLALQMRRFIFHTAGDATPFRTLSDLPTEHRALTRENLRAALLASGSIPLLMDAVKIPGTPRGVHWDGGVLDYHLDLDFGPGEGLVLYPHFYSHVVPGWFDKSLTWRRARGDNFRRALLIAPSDDFVRTLPRGKIPDRKDFYAMDEATRLRTWQRVVDESVRLGDELAELQVTGRLAGRLEPW
ncbi:MAG: patatin-like phospholipase family protein [Gemmatimonadaceae bacterium]|nr:patatin-like phospholipase family protein [Gemmatimonadota bacterium]MBP9105137.1 patatin-like phospholipase family protein [Gemmatimonadaceae bacterium]MBK9410461.1 patatin-like phospholipase family protein [Gemmatimonadota bacterium]MBK9976604.1 patatin-like phospholipase family protein [Gemmatimonadota bacterium]MCC7323273.1 patatin-like phospholipase family protein [Gemmatimonadaceae bacterium]